MCFGVGHGTALHAGLGSRGCRAVCLVPGGWFLAAETAPPGQELAAVLVKVVFFIY